MCSAQRTRERVETFVIFSVSTLTIVIGYCLDLWCQFKSFDCLITRFQRDDSAICVRMFEINMTCEL
jgi:hypothetical protein